MKRWIWYAVAAIALLLMVVNFVKYFRPSIDEEYLAGCRASLSAHNAKFLGRTANAARYELILTDERGEVSTAWYRLPVATRKLPVLLLAATQAREAEWSAWLDGLPRINDVVVVSLSNTVSDDATGKSWSEEWQKSLRSAGLALQYVHRHFAVDTNRVAVIGLNKHALFASAVGAHYPESVTTVYTDGIPAEGSRMQQEYATWVLGHAHPSVRNPAGDAPELAFAAIIESEAGPVIAPDTSNVSGTAKFLRMK